MNARTLHMLHDAGDEGVDAVADRVDLYLGAHQVLVHQNGVLLRDGIDNPDLLANVVVVVGNVHTLAAQNVGGAHQHRVAQLVSRL